MKLLSVFYFFFASLLIDERVVSTSTTITNSDQIVRNTGGAVTFTLPTSPVTGQEHTIINTGTGNITLSAGVLVYNNTAINIIPPYNSQIMAGWNGGNRINIYWNGTQWLQK